MQPLKFTILAPYFNPGARGHHGSYPPALLQAALEAGLKAEVISSAPRASAGLGPRIGFASVHPLTPFINVKLLLWLLTFSPTRKIIYFGEGTLAAAIQLSLALVNPALSLIVQIMKSPTQTINSKIVTLLNNLSDAGRLHLLADGPVIQHNLSKLGILSYTTPLYSLMPSNEKSYSRSWQERNLKTHLRIYFVARFPETVQQFLNLEPNLCRDCRFVVHVPEEMAGKANLLLASEAPRNLEPEEYVKFLSSFDRVVIIYPQKFENVSAKALDAVRLGIQLVLQEDTATSRALEGVGGITTVDFGDEESALEALGHGEIRSSVSLSDGPGSMDDYLRYLASIGSKPKSLKLSLVDLTFLIANYIASLGAWLLSNFKRHFHSGARN